MSPRIVLEYRLRRRGVPVRCRSPILATVGSRRGPHRPLHVERFNSTYARTDSRAPCPPRETLERINRIVFDDGARNYTKPVPW